MTRYDDPPASDGHGGPHPLAGVPQEALDDARAALQDATLRTAHGWLLDADDEEELDAIADAVVCAAMAAMRRD